MAFLNVTPGARALSLALCFAAAACGDGDSAASPAQKEAEEARNVAARQVCIGQVLADQAAEQLQTLQSAGAPQAALVFAKAYDRRAQLQASSFAQLDSAYSHSPTPEDSVRHVELAEGFSTAAPAPGSVEANAAQNYQQRFALIFQNRDHPCNLRVELADSAAK